MDLCTSKWWTYPTERPDIDNGTGRTSGATLFYSPEQLDPENPGIAEARNLYLYRNGKVQYVTTFDSGMEAERYNVSPDGRYVALITRSKLTGYDNVGGPQVYCNRNISRPRGQNEAFNPGEPKLPVARSTASMPIPVSSAACPATRRASHRRATPLAPWAGPS